MELFKARSKETGITQPLFLGLELLKSEINRLSSITKLICTFFLEGDSFNLEPNQFNSLTNDFFQSLKAFNAKLVNCSLNLVEGVLTLDGDLIASEKRQKLWLGQLIDYSEKLQQGVMEMSSLMKVMFNSLTIYSKYEPSTGLWDDLDSIVNIGNLILTSKTLIQVYESSFYKPFDKLVSILKALNKNPNSIEIQNELVNSIKEIIYSLELFEFDPPSAEVLREIKDRTRNLKDKINRLSEVLEEKQSKERDSRNRLGRLGELLKHLMGLFSNDKN